jgi:transcriptional regulator with XRE-family HTH domain
MSKLITNYENAMSDINSEIVARLKTLLKEKKVSRPKLGEMTGISASRWGTVFKGLVHPRFDEIMQVCNIWPMHRHWLIFGDELPSSGQVSPETFNNAIKFLSEGYENVKNDQSDKNNDSLLIHVDSLGWWDEMNAINLENVFQNRTKHLMYFYLEGDYEQAYKDEHLDSVERLKKRRQRFQKKTASREITLTDVKAIEWLEFLASTALKKRYMD